MQHDLWNRADISKHRVSSGHDYLVCNSNLKIPLGFSAHCYCEEMFRIPQTEQVQEDYIQFHHHRPPVVQDMLNVNRGRIQHMEQSTCEITMPPNEGQKAKLKFSTSNELVVQ